MFLAILGIILILGAIFAVIGYRGYVKRVNSTYYADLEAAEDAVRVAKDDYRRYEQWRNAGRNTEEGKALDTDGKWAADPYSAQRDIERSLDAANRAVDLAKSTEPNAGTLMVTIVGVCVALFGVILILTQCFYRQDVGEAKVQVSWSGQLEGQTTTPGFHLKAPWVSVRTFDVRNNLVAYVGESEEGKPLPNYSGNVTTGPQITFQDKEGVTGNMDLTLRYSIEPGSVLDVYSQFGTQENFVNKVISEGVRAETREAPATKGTLEVYSDRAGLATDIMAGLEERWASLGIIIEDVAIQEIRYSAEVRARFDEAQAARIAVTKAEADQEAAKVTAETKVIEAQGVADAAVVAAEGQAEANRLLTESLTEEVLTQRYIDALNEGTVFVVPDGSTPLITTGK